MTLGIDEETARSRAVGITEQWAREYELLMQSAKVTRGRMVSAYIAHQRRQKRRKAA